MINQILMCTPCILRYLRYLSLGVLFRLNTNPFCHGSFLYYASIAFDQSLGVSFKNLNPSVSLLRSEPPPFLLVERAEIASGVPELIGEWP